MILLYCLKLNNIRDIAMKLYEKVEGKGYFTGFSCKNCGKERDLHKASGKNCPQDMRRSIVYFKPDSFYEEDKNKPIFVRVLI